MSLRRRFVLTRIGGRSSNFADAALPVGVAPLIGERICHAARARRVRASAASGLT
jgi:hypothetical protein